MVTSGKSRSAWCESWSGKRSCIQSCDLTFAQSRCCKIHFTTAHFRLAWWGGTCKSLHLLDSGCSDPPRSSKRNDQGREATSTWFHWNFSTSIIWLQHTGGLDSFHHLCHRISSRQKCRQWTLQDSSLPKRRRMEELWWQPDSTTHGGTTSICLVQNYIGLAHQETVVDYHWYGWSGWWHWAKTLILQ